MRKALVLLFVLFLFSFVHAENVEVNEESSIEDSVSRLFDNADTTVKAIKVPVSNFNLLNQDSVLYVVDSIDWEEIKSRFGDEFVDDFLEKNTKYGEFDLEEGSARLIEMSRDGLSAYSDYYLWVYLIDEAKGSVVVYIGEMPRQRALEKVFVESVSREDFRKVDCGIDGRIKFGESVSCLLPELDGSTVTVKVTPTEKNKTVKVETNWNYSFFKDVFWQDSQLNFEYASKYDALRLRKVSDDNFVDFDNLLLETEKDLGKVDPSLRVFSDYWVVVLDLYSDEVRFKLGKSKREDSCLTNSETGSIDCLLSKAEEHTGNFVRFDCAPDKLWVEDLTFTKEELEQGINTKRCFVPGSWASAEVIEVKVNSIKNGGRNVSFSAKYIDVTDAFAEILEASWTEEQNIIDFFGEEKVVDLFLQYPNEFVEIAKVAGIRSRLSKCPFTLLRIDVVADWFVDDPDVGVDTFVEIVRVTGRDFERACKLLGGNERVAALE